MEDDISKGDKLSSRGTIEKAKQSFEEAIAGIGPIADTIMRQVTVLGPESVGIEFGVKFTAQAGVMIASSAIEGNCKVTLNWKPKDAG